mgnify:CR=1 FL=1
MGGNDVPVVNQGAFPSKRRRRRQCPLIRPKRSFEARSGIAQRRCKVFDSSVNEPLPFLVEYVTPLILLQLHFHHHYPRHCLVEPIAFIKPHHRQDHKTLLLSRSLVIVNRTAFFRKNSCIRCTILETRRSLCCSRLLDRCKLRESLFLFLFNMATC